MTQITENETIKKAYNAAYKEEIKRGSGNDGISEFEFVCNIIEKYLKRGDVVYDIGSGTGKYSEHCLLKGNSVGCVDISDKLIDYFNRRIGSELKNKLIFSKTCCATNLEWISVESADLVLLMGPMYHITDLNYREKVYYQIYNILKKNGILIVVFLNSLEKNDTPPFLNHNIIRYQQHSGYDISHVRFGGFSVPQFRCKPIFAVAESKEWFIPVEINKFRKHFQVGHTDSKHASDFISDQYTVVFRKR
jgi:SAM-dependent methyltransferase